MTEEVFEAGDQEWFVADDADEVRAAELAAARLEAEQDFEEIRDENAPRGVIAIVGRPNVGKSTLVNRIIGRREAVVEDVPGVTRDRVAYEAEWAGVPFVLLDTGGYEVKAQGMSALIAEQAEVAMAMADVVVLVVDATVGATNDDEAVVRLMRRSRKPVLLCANKVDDARAEADATALWSLGLGEPFAVSALHGRGSGELLDAMVEALPAESDAQFRQSGPRRIAIVGKPNVGKSSLLNQLAGEHRAVVSPVAGTTVDPVDELIEIEGRTWRFVDTAGIRRRVAEASGHEYFAVLRTRAALEKAELALVMIDAGEQLSEQDQRIVSMVVDSGRAVVLAFNKWDLVDEDRRRELERQYEVDLQQVHWAPRINLVAKTGRNVQKLVPHLERALEGWDTRIPTGRLNQFLGELVASHPHPLRGGKQPRILFGTQAGIRPPTFVLFTSGFLEAGYRRFIERRLREEFGFEGSPIRIQLRIRAKRHG